MIWMLTHTILGDKAGLAYDLVPLDGDLPKVQLLDASIDIGIWPIPRVHAFFAGRRIRTENLPTRLRAKYGRGGGNTRKSGVVLPDFIGVQQGQVVSEQFRALVEAYDPGRHQFEPVSVVWTEPETDPLAYFWFIPTVRLFSLDPDKTQPPLSPVSGQFQSSAPLANCKPVFRKIVVADHAVFATAEWAGIFITSKFKDALEAVGMTGYRTFGPFDLDD